MPHFPCHDFLTSVSKCGAPFSFFAHSSPHSTLHALHLSVERKALVMSSMRSTPNTPYCVIPSELGFSVSLVKTCRGPNITAIALFDALLYPRSERSCLSRPFCPSFVSNCYCPCYLIETTQQREFCANFAFAVFPGRSDSRKLCTVNQMCANFFRSRPVSCWVEIPFLFSVPANAAVCCVCISQAHRSFADAFSQFTDSMFLAVHAASA